MPFFYVVLNTRSQQGNGQVVVQTGVDGQDQVLQDRCPFVHRRLEGDQPAAGDLIKAACCEGGKRPEVKRGEMEVEAGQPVAVLEKLLSFDGLLELVRNLQVYGRVDRHLAPLAVITRDDLVQPSNQLVDAVYLQRGVEGHGRLDTLDLARPEIGPQRDERLQLM